MFAYSYSRYGAADVVEKVEVPTPAPSSNEVLIQIHATTVSSGDWRARSLTVPKGMGLIARLVFGVLRPRKPILGTELSGVVVEVGKDVTNFAPGDAVIGFPSAGFGAHAEYITMPADGRLVPMPAALSFEEAAAIPFGATTAYDFVVNKGQIKAGESVLINGASGAVGAAAVQIAKHLGASVTAVCSGRNAAMVRELGADHVIDYTKEDFASGDTLYDVVVDTVATAPWVRTRRALRPGGRMVMIAGNTGDIFLGALRARLSGKRLIGGVAGEGRKILVKVVDLTERGILRPVIDRAYPFDEMVAAHRHTESGHKTGAVVVSVVPPARARRVASA